MPAARPRRHRSLALSGSTRARWLAGLLALLPALSWALDPHMPFRDYVLDHWGTAHGLPQISVQSIAQDRDGFLWFGTQNGIARFDGSGFQVYDSSNESVDTSLVSAAWGDADGAVWFGTARGLLREREGRFRQWSIGRVNAIAGDGRDQPLLATDRGVGRWYGGRLHPLPGLEGPFFSLLDHGGTLWAGGLGRLCRYRAQGTRCLPLPGTGERRVTALARVGDTLWVGTSAGLLRLHADRLETAAPLPQLADADILALLRDRQGTLWIGTVTALCRIWPDGRAEAVGGEGLPADPWIEALFQDRDGNLWLGSRTQSLFRVADSWTRRYGRTAGLDDPFVWTLAPGADGIVMAGTNSGLAELRDGRASMLVPGSDLPNPAVYALYRDRRGRLWLGTRGGVALWDHGKLQTPPQLATLRPWQVNTVLEYPAGTFWFGTQGGLYRLRDDRLERFGASAAKGPLHVRALLPLAGGALLLGTERGVRIWRDGRILAPAWASPLDGHFITALGWLDPHALLLTTMDAGLAVLRDGRLHRYTEAQGLPGNNAWGFAVHGGDVWFSSIHGIWRLPAAQLLHAAPPTGLQVQRVLGGDNRIGNQQFTRCCNGGGSGRLLPLGDTLWLPSINGALALAMDAVRAPPALATPRIESLDDHGHWYPPHTRLRLPLGRRSIEIGYTVPDPGGSARLRFRYRLEGFDAGWVPAGTRRAAFYTGLPPGTYRFEVQARRDGGAWSPPARIVLAVPAYWYEWRWLWLATAAAALLLAFALVRLRLRRQRLLQRRLEALVTERTEALRRSNERLRQANDALTAENLSDPLTRLGNRRLLGEHWPSLRRAEQVAVMLIDLDHFKRINDRYGHSVGDVVLREVAALVQRLKEPQDLALRWGGEEFLLLLPGVSAEAALALGERIRLAVRAHRFHDPSLADVQVTCSIGLSCWPLLPQMRDRDAGGAIELADLAMYRAKSQGRDACRALLPGPHATAALLTAPAADVERLLAAGVLRWLASG